MIVQEARFATALPGRLILKLCKHFRHKVPAEFDEQHGRVEFQPGLCFLTAEAGALHIRIEGADDGQIDRMHYILEDHIRRMQRLETLQLGWQVAG
ncbi:DUF2218 domain-containing protein [Uliginosibacterium sp. H1]|uniref:DUF2218 domain-containing protein n=1 Tax=Uliginosibacterium sp. H1 TaxID=3114757 RepID=UPI002E199D4E|nr:DUF2218 domain-containing protein [Uliginosibacterium sp. H1]